MGGAVRLSQVVNPFVMTGLLLHVRWLLNWPSSRGQEGVHTGGGGGCAVPPHFYVCTCCILGQHTSRDLDRSGHAECVFFFKLRRNLQHQFN